MRLSSIVCRWPLRYFVPCMLLVSALVLSVFKYQIEILQQIPAAQQQARNTFQRTLHQTADNLEYLLQGNDLNRVQFRITELMADYLTQEAWFADANGRILAASRLEKINQQAQLPAELNPEIDRQQILAGDNQLDGLQPLILNRDNKSLRPQRLGYLYVHQDLSFELKMTRIKALRQAQGFAYYALALCFCLWVYFHAILYRRLCAMNAAAAIWSLGAFEHRLSIEGQDELSMVAQTLNQMAAQNGSNWDKLEQQKRTILENNVELATLQRALDQHAAISITDTTGCISYVNDKFCQLTGYSRAELIGANHRILKSGVHDQHFYANLWDTISGGEIWHGRFENRRKDGLPCWMQISIIPRLDTFGVPTGFIGVSTDITQSERLIQAMQTLSETSISEQAMFETIAKTISQCLGCRWSGVGLFKGNQIEIQGLWMDGEPMQLGILSLTNTPCETVFERNAAVIVTDHLPEHYSSPLLSQWGAQSYRGVPLHGSLGQIIGVLFAIDDQPCADLPSERALLQFIAHRATQLLDKERISKQLQDSEIRFRKLFKDSVQATLLFDGGGFVDCNSAALSLLGFSNEAQLLHRSPLDISPEIQPDGETSLDKAARYIELALSVGHCNFEWEHLRADGKPILTDVVLTAISFGERQLIHSVCTDITQRKQAEKDVLEAARYTRSLIEASLDPLVTINPDGKITDLNQATEQVTGLSRQQLVDSDFCDYFTDPDQARLVYQEVLHKGKVLEYPLSLRHASGSIIEVLYNAALYYDSTGKVAGVFAAARDVTERNRLEQQQSMLQLQLQQAQKMEAIGQLTGGIAHDFNNILAAILGYTGLALDRFVPDKESKLANYLFEVQSAGERARDLIAKMLAFSRGTKTGSIPVDAGALITEVVKTLRSVISSTIEINTDIAPKTPAVMADPVQLFQVLMNLAINARDAIDIKGNIQLTTRYPGRACLNCPNPEHCQDCTHQLICASCHKPFAGDFVEIDLRDNGSGIPSQTLLRIFDPFFTTKEVGKGTGMGLAMVHGIMHEHGGHVLVESSPGIGTTFRLFCKAANTTAENPDPDNPVLKKPALSSKEILVIDDEISIGNMLGELLRSSGYQACVFNDSQQALAAFNAEPERYKLVITDQTMPKLSGTELANKILEIRPQLPIIMATGFSDQIDEQTAQRIGIKAYLQKPLNLQTLLAAMKQLLDQQAPDP